MAYADLDTIQTPTGGATILSAWGAQINANFDAMFPVIAPDVAWTDWSPTLANVTVGNGTTTAKYFKFGRSVVFELKFVMGSTSAMGTNPTYTLPVTANARYTLNIEHYGTISILDSGTAILSGQSFASSTTVGLLGVLNASATYATISGFTSTIPMTWATGDAFSVKGFYEAAV